MLTGAHDGSSMSSGGIDGERIDRAVEQDQVRRLRIGARRHAEPTDEREPEAYAHGTTGRTRRDAVLPP